MKTKFILIDILTFFCIHTYAEDSKIDDSETDYLENLKISSGAISTNIFNFQEQFWNHSYIMRSLFGHTECIGISASYQFTDWVSADAIIMPIEGVNKINYSLGVTFVPINGLHLRLYTGVNDNNENYKYTTINMAAFLGYKCNIFTIGAELNHTLNSSYNFGKDYYGYSIITSIKMSEFADFYFRFDDIYSKNNWNIFSDLQSAVLGLEFKLNDKISLTPNFKMIIPKAQGLNRSYFGFINCSINL